MNKTKKRIITLLLCMMMLVSVFPASAFATVRFTDVTDAVLAQNTDILGLLGVISDSSDKLFRPDDNLKRAEFCKMAVIILGQEKEAAQYKNASIFPDVRASHWASGHIGVAAKGENKFIGGYPDGSFKPENPINYGEAITILMRVLGYTDKDSGAVWPQGYIDLAKEAGVSVYGLKGTDYITRAQAAALFVDVLTAEGKSGSVFYKTLGTVSGDVTISSIDAGNGLVRFSNGSSTVLAHPVAAGSLVGKTGKAVEDSAGKMTLFIPNSISQKDAPGSAAIIVAKDGSTAGFDVLSGGEDYTIYKNGLQITAADIKKNDVASYSPSTNSIVLSDNSISVYYEDCTPNASAPTSITILGNTKLEVLATAADSLKAYKPGTTVNLLLTAEGKVAGANGSYSEMPAAVDENGKISLICGSVLIPVVTDQTIDSKYYGKVVNIHSYKKNDIAISIASSSVNLGLDVKNNTVDGKLLADNAMIFEEGKLVSKADITKAVPASDIEYVKYNKKGQAFIVSYKQSGEISVYAGMASKEKGYEDSLVGGSYEIDLLRLSFGEGSADYKEGKAFDKIPEGEYVVASLKEKASGNSFTNIHILEKLGKVTKTSFIGKTVVNCNGVSYELAENTAYYNADAKRWMSDFDSAYAYADEFTLYAYDGTVYLMEVNAVVK